MKYRPQTLHWLRRPHTFDPAANPTAGLYADALRRVYRAIAELTGDHVIVDSSKRAMHIFAGVRLAEMPAHVVHLVRDPRAITYSWPRRSTDTVILGPGRVSLNWMASNVAAETFRDGAYTFVRYEDFVRQPLRVLSDLVDCIDGLVAQPTSVNPHTFHMQQGHTVAGSPSRFKTGDVTLTPDDEWRRGMKTRDRLVSMLLTMPLSTKYGYGLRSSPA